MSDPRHCRQSVECFCSGVSSQCAPSSRHYWSTLRVPVTQTDTGWGLVDMEGDPLVTSLVYDEAMGELTYQHDPGEQQIHYWSLPEQFLGEPSDLGISRLTIY